MDNKLYKSAIYYVKRAWAIFPVHYLENGECSCGNKDCSNIAKHPLTPHGLKDATTELDKINEWWTKYPDANIGIVAGQVSGIVVIDIDTKHNGFASLEKLEAEHGKLPETITVTTGSGGRHYYFKYPNRTLKNTVNILPGIDFRGDGGYVVAPPSMHTSGNPYKWDDVELLKNDTIAALPEWFIQLLTKKEKPVDNNLSIIPFGQRNDVVFRKACELRARGIKIDDATPMIKGFNADKCKPPLFDDELKNIINSAYRYEISSVIDSEARTPITKKWDTKIAPEAYHGIAGKIVRLIEPHTEADPVALLIQFLVFVGNVVGRNPYFLVGADRHYPNLFVVLVGNSSKGRKGTSWSCIKNIFRNIDPESRQCSGLSSGEGLIWSVRDPIYKKEPIREKKDITGYQDVLIDEGISNKRLLVVESEFTSVLKMVERAGNTLSPVIRDSWDGNNLSILTKNTPAKATEPHISIIGHITTAELKRYLTLTEMANGFGNRFLWIYARRSKMLPNGGELSKVDFSKIETKLHNSIFRAKEITRQVAFDSDAQELWKTVYESLSREKQGIAGILTNRNEAQALRLATLYAILDESDLIKPSHLMAALAIIDYSEESCRFIFGDSLGDLTADEIYKRLSSSEDGLTRTDIRNLFHNNKSKEQVDAALQLLKDNNRASSVCETTEGRPVEKWVLTKRKGTTKTT